MSNRSINLIGRDRTQLLQIADRACSVLASIASQVTTDEGDREETEDDIGLPVSEVIEMAHDEMIGRARATLDSIIKEFK